MQRRHTAWSPNPQVRHQIYRNGQTPGDGVGEVDGFNSMESGNLEHGCQPDQAQAADTYNRNNHWHHGVSQAAQRAYHYIHNAAEGIDTGNIAEPHQPGGDYRRAVGVDVQKWFSQQDGSISQYNAYRNDAELSGDQDAVDPLLLPGTVVLAGEGKGSLIKGIHCHVDKALNICSGRIAGYNHVAKEIDGGLNHHVGDGEHDALESGRKADLKNLPHLRTVNPQLAEFQVDAALFPDEAAQHQESRDSFGNGGGNCHTHNIHAEQDNEDQVQNNVDDTSAKQEIQRPLGISYSAEQGAAEVIDHGRSHAQEVDPQINGSKGQNFFRRLHPDQHLLCADYPYNGQKNAAYHTQQHGSVNRFGQILLRLCSVKPGGGNVCADRQADKQVGEQIDQSGIGANGGKGIVTGEFSHHNNICRIEQKLQNTGQHQRHCKQQHLFQDRTAAHIHFIRTNSGTHNTPLKKCRFVPVYGTGTVLEKQTYYSTASEKCQFQKMCRTSVHSAGTPAYTERQHARQGRQKNKAVKNQLIF